MFYVTEVRNQDCKFLLRKEERRMQNVPTNTPADRFPPPLPSNAMSLHSLKETLQSSSFSQPQSESQPRSPPPLLARRPPKTSLSQQLLRLDASSSSSSFSVSPPPPPRTSPTSDAAADDAPPLPEVEDEVPCIRPRASLPPAAALDSRGPYEPLVLSPPGERPVVQVKSMLPPPSWLLLFDVPVHSSWRVATGQVLAP